MGQGTGNGRNRHWVNRAEQGVKKIKNQEAVGQSTVHEWLGPAFRPSDKGDKEAYCLSGLSRGGVGGVGG